MGQYEPIWMARGEKRHVKKVDIIVSDRDLFLGLCHKWRLCQGVAQSILYQNLKYNIAGLTADRTPSHTKMHLK